MTKKIMRISTRGYYSLVDGKTMKNNTYFLYPKKDFDILNGTKEIVIMIHGLRNDNAGAVAKTVIAKNRLRQLGYKFPVLGYSYDSNIKGAHLIKHAKRALAVGQMIAKKNGRNLSLFVQDFKAESPDTKIRLIGHSLGSQVILSAIGHLSRNVKNKGIIDSVYLFGASITNNVPSSKKYGPQLDMVVSKKIINYFSPCDEVLYLAAKEKFVNGPLGLNGVLGKPISKYSQRLVAPKNHRFASYVDVLKKFP